MKNTQRVKAMAKITRHWMISRSQNRKSLPLLDQDTHFSYIFCIYWKLSGCYWKYLPFVAVLE